MFVVELLFTRDGVTNKKGMIEFVVDQQVYEEESWGKALKAVSEGKTLDEVAGPVPIARSYRYLSAQQSSCVNNVQSTLLSPIPEVTGFDVEDYLNEMEEHQASKSANKRVKKPPVRMEFLVLYERRNFVL